MLIIFKGQNYNCYHLLNYTIERATEFSTEYTTELTIEPPTKSTTEYTTEHTPLTHKNKLDILKLIPII